MDNINLISKSDLVKNDPQIESHHNLLSDALEQVKNHPVETVMLGVAVAATAYNLPKLLGKAAGKSEGLSNEAIKDISVSSHLDVNDFRGLPGLELAKLMLAER